MILNELNVIFTKIGKTKKDFDLFIETGSYVGETLDNIKSEFDKLISIEITEKYFNYCKAKFANYSNIEMIRGDSVIILPNLIAKYSDKNVIFFLDGHYSAGDTGTNGMDCPVIEELKIINEKHSGNALIVIDDSDLFEYVDSNICWSGINEKNILNVITRPYKYFYLQNIKPIGKQRMIIELNQTL